MSTDNADFRIPPPNVNADLDEQVRARGIRPIRSAEDLKGPEGLWETDEEVYEFIRQVYADRRADMA
jgi:hypothetical protein